MNLRSAENKQTNKQRQAHVHTPTHTNTHQHTHTNTHTPTHTNTHQHTHTTHQHTPTHTHQHTPTHTHHTPTHTHVHTRSHTNNSKFQSQGERECLGFVQEVSMESVALMLPGKAFHREGATNLKALWLSGHVASSWHPLAREHQGQTLIRIEESAKGVHILRMSVM